MRSFFSQRFILVLITFSLLCCSCAPHPPPPLTTPVIERPVTAAEELFLKGDYENALRAFTDIYATGLFADDRIAALYGLACTQMILARSENQYFEAIATLERWDSEKGSSIGSENRQLIILAIKQQGNLLQTKSRDLAKKDKQKNQLIAAQKKRIEQMATAVDNLQKQLEEFETIDLNFQERRKPL